MITPAVREFRQKIASRVALGPFSKTSDPAFIEALGHSGFDFVVLDLEHGPTSVQSLQNLIRAAQLSGVLPIVRVKEKTLSLVGEVLDVGAGGIQVPKITSRRDVEQVLEAAKFAPRGMRGVCRFVRAADYSSADRFAYFSESNETVIVLQLEGVDAIGNIDDILSVEGIDIVFVGPYDLSQSLGVAGQVRSPQVLAMMRTIVERCLARGVVVGTFVDTIEDAKRWQAAGVRFLCYSVDVGLFTDKCREVVSSLSQEKDSPCHGERIRG